MNIIHTKGIRTGLIIKYALITFYLFGKILDFKIPMYPVGYDRKHALYIREMDNLWENDEENWKML